MPRQSSSPASKRPAPKAEPAKALTEVASPNLVIEILKFAAKNLALPVILCVAENKYLPAYLKAPGPVLGLPRAFGLVVLLNVFGTVLFTIVLGFKVGGQRSSFAEKAKKDGDTDAEARFSYPKMYAEGFSDYARGFNCLQRGHQHTLETYPHVLAMSVLGGLSQPATTATAGLLWLVARHKWAKGYATGDPKNRYEQSDGWGRHIWTALLMMAVTCIATGVQCLLL